jgi:hypothetical protein
MAETFKINDVQRLQLKQDLAEYLRSKPTEEELKAQLKEIRTTRCTINDRILQTMDTAAIPKCTSRDYGYEVSVVNKKRTTAAKPKELLECLEELYGPQARQRVEELAKTRFEVVKESKSLKLQKIDGATGKRVNADGSLPAKRVRKAKQVPANASATLPDPDVDEEDASVSVSAAAKVPLPPARYDEESDVNSSDSEDE